MAVLQQSGQALPRLDYVCRHLKRFLPALAAATMPRASAKLDDVMDWAGVKMKPYEATPLRAVMSAAAKNMHSNGYHHPWHTMTVMIFSAILGQRAGLRHEEMMRVMMYALVHDLDHRGRMITSAPYGEELRSAQIAGRRLYATPSGRGPARRQMTHAIAATYFGASDDGNTAQHHDHFGFGHRNGHGHGRGQVSGDEVTQILLDADFMASIILPDDAVMTLTRGLKREQGSVIDAADMRDAFLTAVQARGFAHHASQALVDEMLDGTVAQKVSS